MAQTPSEMIPLKTTMPDFSLADAHGKTWAPSSDPNGTLIVFMCNHCPFVIHVASILEEIHTMCALTHIHMIGINSNDIQSYPDDSPKNMISTAKEYNWTFPYLFDAEQIVAKAFQATCTPDVFLYDAKKQLYYRGQFDDSRPSNGVADGQDLKNAVKAMIGGQQSPTEQKPAIGCSIKWKK